MQTNGRRIKRTVYTLACMPSLRSPRTSAKIHNASNLPLAQVIMSVAVETGLCCPTNASYHVRTVDQIRASGRAAVDLVKLRWQRTNDSTHSVYVV